MNGPWLTHPIFIVPIKLQRAFLLFIVLFILIITFAPGLWTVTWHVLHGNSVIYKTKRIPVPMWWTAESAPQGVHIERLALTILSSDKPVQSVISLSALRPSASQTHKESSGSFEAVYRTYLAGDRVVTGPVKVLSGLDEGVCMEATAENGSEGFDIACLAFQERWTVSFVGAKRERSEFYEILIGIH